MSDNREMSLYDISLELKPLEEALEDVGGDTDALPPEVVGRVGDLLLASQEKVDAYGRYAKALEANVDAIKNEMARLADRKKVFENRLQRLKDWANEAMKIRGIAKVEGKLTTIWRQKNGGKAPIELLVELESIPEYYIRHEPKADMEKIRHEIERQGSLPFAKLGEVGYNVRIK